MIIYKATFPNGKSYIGRTITSLQERISNHLRSNDNFYFHNAIRKYKNVLWEILEDNINDFEYLKERETFNILKHDTYFPNGYNMTVGGDGTMGYKRKPEEIESMRLRNLGKKASDETRKKMSLSKKGKRFTKEHIDKLKESRRKRLPPSNETKEKIRTSLTGRKHSQETINKFRDGRRKGKNNSMFGRKHRDETKNKISEKVRK